MRCLISAMRLLALSIFSFACANELSVNIANFTHQNRRNVMQGRYLNYLTGSWKSSKTKTSMTR